MERQGKLLDTSNQYKSRKAQYMLQQRLAIICFVKVSPHEADVAIAVVLLFDFFNNFVAPKFWQHYNPYPVIEATSLDTTRSMTKLKDRWDARPREGALRHSNYRRTIRCHI